MASEFLYSASLQFPFSAPEHAAIAARTLNVDDDLKPNESIAKFDTSGSFLVFSVQARSMKFMKKAITTTIPSIELIQRTIEAFAVE
jgi:hypothetical protein